MFGSTTGSTWGQQQQQQQPQQTGAFGQPAQQQQQPGFGAFGSGGGAAFGQPAQPATSGFGASTSTGTSGFGAFAQKPSGFGAATTSGFGAPAQPAAGGFGAFGGGASTSGFGAQPATSSLFGQPQQQQQQQQQQQGGSAFGSGSSLFGAKPAGSGFGSSTALVAPAQNGTQAPPYDQTSERDSSGSMSVNLMYQSISCMPAYRTASFEELRLQDYGQGRKTSGGFGQTAFGGQPAQPQAANMFGGGTTSNAFGQPAATANTTSGFGNSSFGQPAQPVQGFGASSFGQPAAGASGFGQPAAGGFGQQAQPAQTGSLFGSSAPNAFAQPAATGTTNNGFSAFAQKPSGFAAFAQPQAAATSSFGSFGQQQQQQQQPTAAGGFGQPAQQQGGFGAFANNNQPKNLFGQPTTTPGFGQPAQDASAPTGSLFGSGFGQQQPAAGTFGQPAAQPAQPTTSLFGQPAATGTTSLFGQPQQQQPAQQSGFGGGSLFGQKPAAATTGTSLFGQPATGTNPLMPSQPSGSLFGSSTTQQPAQQPAAGAFGSGSLFGAKPTSGFGTTPSLFSNNTTQPAATGSLFGSSTSLPGATGSIFGASSLGGQQQQSLVANIDQPVSHALPVFSLLQPGPKAVNSPTSASVSVLGISTAKRPSHFADLPTRAAVPRLNASLSVPSAQSQPQSQSQPQPQPQQPQNKLRGFSATPSVGTLSGSVSSLALSASPSRIMTSSPLSSSTSGGLIRHPSLSSSLSTMGPEAFATSTSAFTLSGGRRSVKKLVLDKKPGSPAPTDSPSKASPSKVTFNPISSARERERERERAPLGSVEPTPEPQPAPVPAPASASAPVPPRTTTPTPFGGAAHTQEPKQTDLPDGYWIRPSLPSLARATKPIDGLTVGRHGVGSVTFLVPVDLKECPPVADIAGKTVILSAKECTVYPEEETKPDEGTGLNVPARIALEGCWAIDKANREPIRQENHPKHISHVRKLRGMSDTKFISFDVKTGTWTFSVEHFSKYGLGDDDDSSSDDEGAKDMDVETSPLRNRVVKHPKAAAEKEPTPDKASKWVARASPRTMRAAADAEKVYTMQASLFRVPEARTAAAAESASTKKSLFRPHPLASTSDKLAIEDVPTSRSILALKASISNPFASMSGQSTSSVIPSSGSAPSSAAASRSGRVAFTQPQVTKSTGIGAENSVFDAGLSMGRSFRVSWGPGGRLVGAGRLAKTSDPSIRKSGVKSSVTIRRTPLSSAEEPAALSERLQKVVRMQFDHSTIQRDEADTPVATPNYDLRFRHFAALFAPDNKTNEALLWRLLVALFDEIPVTLPERTSETVRATVSALCRRQALSDWLEAAVASAVDVEVQTGSIMQRIFALLSGNQTSRAVQAATDGGNYHLATLIAQHGSDAQLSANIAAQLTIWRQHQSVSFMDVNLLRVYALLAGVLDVLPGVKTSDPLDTCPDIAVTGALDWRRAFGLRLWFGESATMHDARVALDEYEAFFQQTSTAQPLRAGERDAAYQLICAALRPDIPLDATVIPRTFGGNAFDLRMPWHIYIVLGRVLRLRDFSDRQPVPPSAEEDAMGHSPTADLVTSAYALQLEGAGLYPEAVFVLLHLEAANGRIRAIKDLLSRNYTRLSEQHLQELKSLTIPESWLQEAKAALLVSQGKVFDAFQAFIAAGQQQLAYTLAVTKLVPDAVLREDLELLRNIFSSFEPDSVDGWATKGKLFVDYTVIMESPPSFEVTQAAQQLLAAIPGATVELENSVGNDKVDARWAACRARMISNLLEVTGRLGMRFADRGEISLVNDSSRARHVTAFAYESFISVLG